MHQPVCVDFRIVNVCANGIATFSEVMRSHVGSHTDSDTRRSVQQKKRSLGRQHCRLRNRVIEVKLEIYGILFHVPEDIVSQFLQFGLGVSHGSDRVTVHGTEVTLTEYERISLVPVLCQTSHRVINAGVSMRVELAKHLTDNSGRLLSRSCIIQAKAFHSEKHTSLHRFQTISRIRKRTRHND